MSKCSKAFFSRNSVGFFRTLSFIQSFYRPEDLATFKDYLGGGFKYFLFSPLFGEDYHFD